jgi:chromate transporter
MQQQNRISLFDLFKAFLWIGLTGFGGLAMTAHVRKIIVDKKGWMDGPSFDSGLALCQIIPGAIVMQLAAYIGLKLKGLKGSVVAFVGFGLPSFLIMLALSIFYKQTHNVSAIEVVLTGLRVVIVAIVANAAIQFGQKNLNNGYDWMISAIAAILFILKIHPILVLLTASLLGLAFTKKQSPDHSEPVQSKTFRFFLFLIGLVILCAGILSLVNPVYFSLAMVMLHIDLFSFGGGLAAIPIMYHELVTSLGWFNAKTFTDGVILGQVTPGSIIVAATFFGYMHFGIMGSILATICVFTPSFLILMGITPFFDRLKQLPQFNRIINGVMCSFIGLLAVVTFRFATDVHWNVTNIIVVVVALFLLLRKVNVVWIITGGIAFFYLVSLLF